MTQIILSTKKALAAKTSKEVFAIYVSECLPRINSATAQGQRKSWMVYDILVARFGRSAVEAAI